jgi:hypothetical protein
MDDESKHGGAEDGEKRKGSNLDFLTTDYTDFTDYREGPIAEAARPLGHQIRKAGNQER